MSHPVNRIMAGLRGIKGPPVPEEPRTDEYSPIKPPESWKAEQHRLAMEKRDKEPLWKKDEFHVVVAVAVILAILGLCGYALIRAQAQKGRHGVSQNSVDRPSRADERVWKGDPLDPPGRVFVSVFVPAGNRPGTDPDTTKERIDL
jgi:hypothetical protein